MKKNNLAYAQEWFHRADEDELSCVALLEDKISPGNVCFLAQQCAEKYLKGLLIVNGQEFEKVHDLKKLADSLEKSFPRIAEIFDDLHFLNKCYIPSRYPGGFMEIPGWPQAKRAVEVAKSVKKFVLNQII
jgi:HEPN domain-containing protein